MISVCNHSHPAPTCPDSTCYRELSAHAADEIMPGLGDLVRRGLLDPDPDHEANLRATAKPEGV